MKKYIQKRTFEKRILSFFKHDLKNGFYWFDYHNKEINENRRRLINAHLVFTFKKKEKRCSLNFNLGQGKLVVFFSDFCFAFYKTKSWYNHSKNAYLNCYDLFNYPKCKIMEFNDIYLYEKMEKVVGVEYNDRAHDEIFLDYLLRNLELRRWKLIDSATGEGLKIYTLSQVDCKRSNIIWTNSANFKFIDLDNLQYVPLLFDEIHYLSQAGYKFNEMVTIISKYKKEINLFIENIDDGINEICNFDYIFNEYLCFYIKNAKDLKGDYDFLNLDNTKEFPLTHKTLIENQ